MSQFLPPLIVEQWELPRLDSEAGMETRVLSEADLENTATNPVNWLDIYWMFIGPPLFFLVLVGVIVLRRPSAQRFLVWALPFIYTIHQFEEHGWDLYGRRYSFIDYFNYRMDSFGWPIHLTTKLITIINITAVWVMMPAAAIFLEMTENGIPALLAWGLAFANGVLAHALAALVTFSYNPGVAQSLVIMIPAGALFLKDIKETHGVKFVIPAIVYGGPIAHGLFLLLPLYMVGIGVMNDVGFGIVMVVGMALPFIIAQCVHLDIDGRNKEYEGELSELSSNEEEKESDEELSGFSE